MRRSQTGNMWFIATRLENLTPEDLAERAKKHMR